MHDTRVKMKDGTEYCNPLWMWRPEEGWFTLIGEPDLKIYFDDVESAIEEDQRVIRNGVQVIEDLDLFERRDRDLERLAAVTRGRRNRAGPGGFCTSCGAPIDFDSEGEWCSDFCGPEE